MRDPKWLRAGIAAALLPPLAVAAWASPGAAAPSGELTATRVVAESRETAQKSPTSRLAETDRTLLGRRDAAPVAVLVKLDHDPVATYAGGVRRLAATSPAATGRQLTGAAAERSYEAYLAGQEQSFVAELGREVPGAAVRQRLRTVYGGVSAIVPANRIADLKIDGVVAVQKDEKRERLTDSSTEFVGADSLNSELGGASDAGSGVIFGVLDSGAWPEHPSFADQGNLAAPPGPARTCDFGDNPVTPEPDVFECNNKLIGGRPFIDTYNALVGGEVYADSARDSDGHGTHTGSTAAGNVIDSAPIFGVERGPARGVAPGAWVSVYQVCGADGCFNSDSAAAVAQAVLDGVDVINFSISGGANPFTDPVELAFLDAYAAGVFVAASAGNSGPGAATTNHVSPWLTTVAASTQTREFSSTLTLRSGPATLVLRGASVTDGVAADTPVVLASAAPYGDPLCQEPAPAGTFDGVIVACERGVNSRVSKGVNVKAGGAAGMILYNPTLADTNTDNHWLPTVHLADGTEFVAWLADHSGVTATFTAGEKRAGTGDVMAAFSSRGPGGFGIKPDIAAPGVQILAGHTPTPDTTDGGPPGEYFQAIAGTSMSSPHIAGAAVLMKALHPTWTPGQIKSALLTTATTDVVKEDLTTPADPINAVHLNLPSVNAPVMPGKLTTVRTATNVTGQTQSYRVSASAPAKSRITVSPASFSLAPGRSVDLSITISSTAETAQVFGEIKLDATRAGLPTLHLPVGFVPQQGDVTLTSSCGPAQITWFGKSTCAVTAANNSFGAATVDLRSTANLHLVVTGANGARKTGAWTVEKNDVALAGAAPGVPALTPGTIAGYLPLADLGVAPEAVGDEDIVNFDVPGFVYGGRTYTSVGVTSNGYLVVGGGTSQDVEFDPAPIPDPSRPNNVLAPFWTDLNGTGAQGLRVATVSDGVDSWLVAEWNVFVFGTTSNRTFQVWIGLNGAEEIAFAYDPGALPALPAAQATVVGAENLNGSGGEQLPAGTAPTGDLRVISSEPTPGSSVSYPVQVTGVLPGNGVLATSMAATTVPGTTEVTARVNVRFRSGGFQL